MVLADAARDPRKPHPACTAGNEQTIQANTGQRQKTVLAPQVADTVKKAELPIARCQGVWSL